MDDGYPGSSRNCNECHVVHTDLRSLSVVPGLKLIVGASAACETRANSRKAPETLGSLSVKSLHEIFICLVPKLDPHIGPAPDSSQNESLTESAQPTQI